MLVPVLPIFIPVSALLPVLTSKPKLSELVDGLNKAEPSEAILMRSAALVLNLIKLDEWSYIIFPTSLSLGSAKAMLDAPFAAP